MAPDSRVETPLQFPRHVSHRHEPRRLERCLDLIRLLQNLAKNRRLLKDFVVRDLKARYVGSSLGFFWSIVYPIINLLVYLFVFQIVLKTTWGADQSPQEVVLLMLVGIVAWSAFAETLSRTTNILVDNGNLISKLTFPTEILPTYVTLSALVNMIIALPIVMIALLFARFNPTDDPEVLAQMALTGNQGVQIGAALLWIPVLLALQTIFTVGLGFFLSTFNLYWRDTFHVIGVATMVWMFVTPIFYPASKVVEKEYGWMLTINPMHWLLEMYRGVMIKNLAPPPIELLKFGAASLIVFWIGSTFFASQKDRFSDLL